MTTEIVERVLRSARYRDVDPALLARVAEEELRRARSADDAVKRVKRRLHQAVGAFRGQRRGDPLAAVRRAWHGDLADPAFRAACVEVLRTHASTLERVPYLDRFYRGIWELTGVPSSVIDIGCGLGPVALPWMELGAARYVATDVDRRPLETVRSFLDLVRQPHDVRILDAVAEAPPESADVALLLKLVTTLDRQDATATARLIEALRVRHVVVSLPARSLGGRGKGMQRTYRERLERLVAETGRVRAAADASVPNELIMVLTLEPHG